jgi:hypothetical protein
VLASLGASPSEIDELLAYNANVFDHATLPDSFPLPDEPFVAVWEQYLADSAEQGLFEILKDRLVQFQFPIQEGISQTELYQGATRRGVQFEPLVDSITLHYPEKLRLILHQTPAGRLPILITGDRRDFIMLLQALTMRNEPKHIPDSMGALMVAGFNNWDRIRQLRRRWEASHGEAATEEAWHNEFQRIIPQKTLYQDRFIILSDGPYSAVPAQDIGLSEAEWKEISLLIRMEHECTHYFTRRIFSSMRNNLIDELIADYMGITGAIGHYRADWFLRFVGLENYPDYREGGRLQNYRGDPPLSEGAFNILKMLVKRAAENVERFDAELSKEMRSAEGRALVLIALTYQTLEELASDEAVELLQKSVIELQTEMRH